MKPNPKRSAIKGACFCGAVRFEARLPSRFCSHCHCENCRRAHSAAYVTYLGFKSDGVRVTSGRASLAAFSYGYQRKGRRVVSTRRFCGRCGTPLFFESTRWPGETHVARAAVPGEVDRRPQLHFYFDRRPSWSSVDDRLPKYGGKDGSERIG